MNIDIPSLIFDKVKLVTGKFLLCCSVATLFRSWLASFAVGLRTLASQVRAQRHSRIACHIVFWHRKIVGKKQLNWILKMYSPSWIFFKIQKKKKFLKYRQSA